MKRENFLFKGNEVRLFTDEQGEHWWVGKEICDLLEIKNSRDALAKLEDDERDDVVLTDAIGRNQKQIIINEAGVFRLIFSSEKVEAKEFKRWLAHEVLPKIRKEGGYGKLHELGKKTIQNIELQRQKESEIQRLKNELKATQESLNTIRNEIYVEIDLCKQLELEFVPKEQAV